VIKEDTIVANTQTQFVPWRAQFLHITLAIGQEVIYRLQDLQLRIAFDRAKPIAGFWRPQNVFLLRSPARNESQFTQEIFVPDPVTSFDRSTGAVEHRSQLGADCFLFHRRAVDGAGNGIDDHFEESRHRRQLARIELIDQLVGMLLVSVHFASSYILHG